MPAGPGPAESAQRDNFTAADHLPADHQSLKCALQEFSELHPLCRQYLAQQSDLLDRLVPALQSLEQYLDQPLQHHNYQDALKVFEMVVLRWGCAMSAHLAWSTLQLRAAGQVPFAGA